METTDLHFVRIQGKKHHEVCSHILKDGDDWHLYCGRSSNGMEIDFYDADVNFQYGYIARYSGRTLVMHALCRSCLRELAKEVKRNYLQG